MSVTSGIKRAIRYLEDRGYEVVRIDLRKVDVERLKQEWGDNAHYVDADRPGWTFSGHRVEVSAYMPVSVVVAKDALDAEIEEDILP